MTNKKGLKERIKEKWQKLLYYAKEIILSPVRFIRFLCFSIGAFVLVLMLALGMFITNFFNSMPDIENKTFAGFKKDAIESVHKKFQSESQS